MSYIAQLPTSSFLIGLVKSESCFIVTSVETGLESWTLMVAVISADAYAFLTFSDLTCHLQDNWIGGKDDKDTKLGSNKQEPSPSAGKIPG